MSGMDSTATDQGVPPELISFFKAILDCRYRRGVRYPQWFLLLVAVLGILCGCRSSRVLMAFAKRHREALNQAGPWPEFQALAFGCDVPLPIQQGPSAGILGRAAGLDDLPDPSWCRGFRSVGV